MKQKRAESLSFVGIRLPVTLKRRLVTATTTTQYKLSLSQIVIRGIELALAEIERKQGKTT